MRCFCTVLLAAGLAAGAAAQTAPAAPSRGASQATAPSRGVSQTTAPTAPAARAADTPRADAEARAEPAAIPQVAVPLNRHAAPNPTAVKPGRAAPERGTVDEAAARCRASVNAPAGCARADRPTRP